MAFEDGPPPGEGSDTEAAAAKGDISASKKPVQVTAEDLADEEWGPIKEKVKKVKKGKGKKGKVQDDENSDEETKPSTLFFPSNIDSMLIVHFDSTGCH